MANLEIINVGTSPNDGEGDPLRTAFIKVNNNFANVWATGFQTLESITEGNSTQEIWQYPVDSFTQAMFQINSSDNDSTDSQNVVINASINTLGTQVKFNLHSMSVYGNAITSYDMNIIDGNVVLSAEPLLENQIKHFIAYQVTFNPVIMGMDIVTNQDSNIEIITESTDSIITTEN